MASKVSLAALSRVKVGTGRTLNNSGLMPIWSLIYKNYCPSSCPLQFSTEVHLMSQRTGTISRPSSTALSKAEVMHNEVQISEFDMPPKSPGRPHNRWRRYRQMLREPLAEFAGVMILIIFGNGVDCQVVLTAKGDYLSINFGWAIGVAFGVWISAGISGGHINPAVTLALATWRGFPWRKVPGYIFAQLMGGLTGAALVYANYFHAIDQFEGGRGVRTLKTAGLFSTYPLDYMTQVSAFFSEFLATAVLMMLILAAGDPNNLPPPKGLAPVMLFLLILGIGASLGAQTGYAMNPARDLGPRILTAMAGYGKEVFTFRSHYWLWCPVIAPCLGAQAGAILYDFFFYNGDDGKFSQPDEFVGEHASEA